MNLKVCFSSVCRVWISDKRWVNFIVCFGTSPGLKVISVRFESVVQIYLWVCHWVCSYRLIWEAATSSSAEKKRTSISCNIYIAVINLTFIFLSFLNHARLISSLKRWPLSLVMVMQYPSGLWGQSEQSKDSPRKVWAVRGQSEQSKFCLRTVPGQSKPSPSSVWILQFKDLARIPLRLSWDSAQTTLIT